MSEEPKIEEKVVQLVDTGKLDTKVVPLTYPKTIDGITYESVTIRRVTTQQMADFIAHMVAGRRAVPPMLDLPLEVYQEIDDDDMMVIEDEMAPFTPRRLKAMLQSVEDTGEATSA